MEILDFSSYLQIFEQDAAAGTPAGDNKTETAVSAETQGVLNQIGYLYFDIYTRLLAIAKDYKDTITDVRNIVNAAPDKKEEEMKKAISKVADAMREEFKKEGLAELWKNAGDKTAESFGALATQYKEDKTTLTAVNSYLNRRINSHLNYLQKSKKETTGIKESEINESQILLEGWFATKKGNAKNMLKQVVALDANLESALQDKNLKTAAEKYKVEVKQIKDRLADLSVAKRKDIKEEELDKIQDRLDKIPLELNKEQERFAKENTTNKEASIIFVQALGLAYEASGKEEEIKDKLSKEAEAKKVEDEKKKKEEFEKIRVKIAEEIDPSKIDTTKTNREVQKFQGLVTDVFQSIPGVAETELFKKFERFGADGKFGFNSQGMVVALKAGFGLKDTSRKITQELLDKIVEYAEEKKIKPMEPKKVEKIGDSLIQDFSTFSKINEFDSFLYEEFDEEKFKIAARGGTPGAEKPTSKDLANASVAPGTDPTKNNIKKIPSELVDAVDKEGESDITKKLKKKLLSIKGINEVKKTRDGAIAWSLGMRFFPGGKYWESATGKIGTFDPEEVIEKGEMAKVKDARGNKWVLKYHLQNPLGSLRGVYDLLWRDLNTSQPRNTKLYTVTLPRLSKRELEKIAHYYKETEKRSLLQDMDDEWTNTKEIRDFTRKNYSTLEKYK
jgi:hypothetical protein